MRTHTQSHTEGEHHVNMNTEMGVMLLQAKKYQRLPAKNQKLAERHRTDFPSHCQEKSTLFAP